MAQNLTAADAEKLREYLRKLDDLAKKEPPRLTSEEWDRVWPQLQNGEIPAEYRDRIGVRPVNDKFTGDEPQPAYFDLVWERWNAERMRVEKKYRGAVLKAIQYALQTQPPTAEDGQPLRELLQAIIDNRDISPEAARAATEELLTRPFVAMLQDAPINDITSMSVRGLELDKFTHSITYTTKDGHKIKVNSFDELENHLSTSAKKILHTAIVFLTDSNPYHVGASRINAIVEIPLIEYGEACGYQLTPQLMATEEEQAKENRRIIERVKELKKSLRGDIADLKKIEWSGTITRGRNAGDWGLLSFISSGFVRNGKIIITFDVIAATLLSKAYIMQFPTVLLKHDNRNPNAYAIGYKLALHNSNDQNRAAGTESTLSVKSLLEAAPEIQQYAEIEARGQRNWRDKIKRRLEASLNENVKIGLIKKWQYRAPKTGDTYTPEAAQALTWVKYSQLMIDFVMIDAPEQLERRAAHAAAAKAAAISAGIQPRKRGRPKKAEK